MTEKKMIKRDCNWIGWGLIIYTLISFVVVLVDLTLRMIPIFWNVEDEAEQNRLLELMFEEFEKYGTSMIVSVILGVLFLVVFFINKVKVKELFQTRRKMIPKEFMQILCVFMGAQLVFTYVFELIEWIVNLFGYTAVADMETATATSTTISMFLYAGIFGPIAEELVYRGYVLRSLEKHGKILTIVVSAVLFGIMHANLPQTAFAFSVGLVFAYVAIEYSIGWAIALHVINNCLFGDILSYAIQGFSEKTQDAINNVIFGAFFIAAVIVLLKNRKSIKQYITENKTEKKRYLYVFTTVAIILFILGELFVAIDSLEPLGVYRGERNYEVVTECGY